MNSHSQRMDQVTIQQLIAQSRQGDKHAFGKLVVEYQIFVFKLATKLVYNTAEAEDITQEVFINAWMHLLRFNPQIKFST